MSVDIEEIVLTTEEVTEHLRAVMAEFGPDHVYDKKGEQIVCYYVEYETLGENGLRENPQAPGCLVGQILFRAGVPLEALAEFDNIGSIEAVIEREYVQVPEACNQALCELQQSQDGGDHWGLAEENYYKRLSLEGVTY